jgi:hypothetical protein
VTVWPVEIGDCVSVGDGQGGIERVIVCDAGCAMLIVARPEHAAEIRAELLANGNIRNPRGGLIALCHAYPVLRLFFK